ncbi:phosphoenolpyruvate carboxylase [Aequorivita sp. Q41]|uniref:phosphoenolpyruvate carboxylase n=1 Tax=Aequorivita sp. Q41 TaxID=3153300 RepID=UPI003241DA7E
MNFNLRKQFQIYNALFLNLSYEGANQIGDLIPILEKSAKIHLESGKDPITIVDQFYEDYKNLIAVDKFDFMFKVIQYVERQIVLFDSIEDCISPYELEDQDSVLVATLVKKCNTDEEFQKLIQKLNDISVRIVLTAHPTQFYRPPVLDIIVKLRKQIKNNNIEKVDSLLHQLGLTSLINTSSPTPFEEAKSIIHICRYEYYEAIGGLMYKLSSKYQGLDNYDLVMLGFWPCGDRDGNPNISHKHTKQVVDELRISLMKCYYHDVKSLASMLTFREIENELSEILGSLYKAMFNPEEIVDYKILLNTFEKIRVILIAKYEGLYLDELQKIITKVKVFKNHFASLDIRQDSSVHTACIRQILIANGLINNSIEELEEKELIGLLTKEFVEIPDYSRFDGVILDTLLNIKQLPDLQKLNGELGCHRYIVSNSEDLFAILNIYGLFRWIHKTEKIKFDFVPLFETMKGMAGSEAVMQELYELKPYLDHLKSRSKKQTVMLGFSDGTKDGGYLKANWSIYKCNQKLSILTKKYNLRVAFFDGRGGPPARGGGKTFNFYAARSPEMANNDIQLTIQGQTITSTYGTSDKFSFNAEQMISSGLSSLNKDEKTRISEKNYALFEELSELSYDKYLKLKQHPKFLDYLESMTTLKFYDKTKIGSRPGKRNQFNKLTLNDLRAISYVGSWSQLKQNVPGYFGVGTAFKKIIEEGRINELQNLYSEVPLFKTLIDNCMMSLTKCFFDLTRYMQSNKEYGAFWQLLYNEYSLSIETILKITKLTVLMETESRSKTSIEIREEIVRPLLLIQQYALQMLNLDVDTDNNQIYEKLVVRSLYGNINASRNSA